MNPDLVGALHPAAHKVGCICQVLVCLAECVPHQRGRDKAVGHIDTACVLAQFLATLLHEQSPCMISGQVTGCV